MMAPTVSFGHWIRQQRRVLDLTQDELAVRVGCSVSAIRKIEGDERRPSRQVAELLAEILQIPSPDRPAFLKIARMELACDNLETIGVPAPGALAPPPPPYLAGGGAAAAAQNWHDRPIVRSLPVPPTPLVGRQAEVARICEILSDPACRMLTLTGSGGVGKTRLAIAAAERLAPGLVNGACFVPLAAVTAADSILTAVAVALGLPLHAAGNLPALLAGCLQSRQMLLVLDNLEHLWEDAGTIAAIVQAAPGVQVLVTSRAPLGLLGEWVLEVHGLSLPPPLDREPPEGGDAGGAVTLFLQAARRADPDFAPQAADYAPIAQICRMVEGSPLGIELAAAWVHLMTCREIAAEIERSYDFLATTARNVPLRQRSLRAGFEHSWRLLAPAERSALQALSVFAGGFSRKAAEAVAGADLQLLAGLVAKSLVVRTSDIRYECRCDLHPIVRQYAAEKLEEAGEVEAAARRHWTYFLDLARAADAARNSPQYIELVDQLELESDNLQAALGHLVERDDSAACELAAVLEPYWRRRPVSEAVRWLERTVAVDTRFGAPAARKGRARAMFVLATLGTLSDAMAMMHEVLALARQVGDRRTTALAMAVLGNEGMVRAPVEGADASYTEAQRLAEEDGDTATLVTVLSLHADFARHTGAHGRANELYTASAALAQEIGRTDLALAALFGLGLMALRQGDPHRLEALIKPNLGAWQALHDRAMLGNAYILLARAATMQGDCARALALIDTGEAIFREIAYDSREYIAMDRGDAEYALGNFAAARANYERALERCEDAFDPIVVASSQLGVARCAMRQGDLAAAWQAVERSREVCDATHEGWARALLAFTTAELAWLSRDHALAEEHLRTGLQQVLPLGDQYAIAEALDLWAALLASTARPAQAARLLGAAAALRRRIGAPILPIDEARMQAAVAAAASALGAEAFAAAWQAGETQAEGGLEQLVELALNNR